MRTLTLLDAVTATGAGTGKRLNRGGQGGLVEGIAQALFTGAATVQLEMSIDNENWFPAAVYSSTDGAVQGDGVRLAQYVRGNVTARSSGAITLKIAVPSEWATE